MKVQQVIKTLQSNQLVFQNLLREVEANSVLWKPAPNKWCLLEIIAHLVDEETEDFRARVQLALETPDLPLTPITPELWPAQREYLNKDYNKTLLQFLAEREKSVAWLQTKVNSNWENHINHPDFGKMSAKLFLYNWLAHDYIHIRQINNTKFLYLQEHGKLDLGYAGNW